MIAKPKKSKIAEIINYVYSDSINDYDKKHFKRIFKYLIRKGVRISKVKDICEVLFYVGYDVKNYKQRECKL